MEDSDTEKLDLMSESTRHRMEADRLLRTHVEGLIAKRRADGHTDYVILTEFYWRYAVVPVELIEDLFRMSEKQILEIVGEYEAAVYCECLEEITFVAKSRSDRDRLESLTVLCRSCAKKHEFAEEDYRAAQRRARANYVATLKRMPYSDYLSSEHWQETRQKALEADGGLCRVCRSPNRLNVHHNTYERRGEEALGDLVVLCADCHELFHEAGKLARPPAE